MNNGMVVTGTLCAVLASATARAPRADRETNARAAASDTTHVLQISSLGSTYPLAGSLHGTVTVRADSLVVRIDSGVVQNTMPPVRDGSTVVDSVELRAGIGRPDGNGWNVDTLGSAMPIAVMLLPGQRRSVAPGRLSVPRQPGGPLVGRWLIVEIRARHRGINGRVPGPFTTYMCNERDFDGPPSASDARAARLHAAYNRAC